MSEPSLRDTDQRRRREWITPGDGMTWGDWLCILILLPFFALLLAAPLLIGYGLRLLVEALGV